MKYEETLAYLYSQLPMFHRIGAAAYKADLEKTWQLAELLGNPQNKLRAIHIAGTNGKGSVSNLLASILQEAGYKTGLYTSPHLKDFRERIRINGAMIPETAVSEFVSKHKTELDKIKPSFFEMSFGLCLSHFIQQETDVAVMETGMGGRLDSTNILQPDLSIITNIGLDHTVFLGDTLAKIASEKAGIIKPGIPVVIGEALNETKHVFIDKAASAGSLLSFSSECYTLEKLPTSDFSALRLNITHQKTKAHYELSCPLAGDYQLENMRTLLTAVDELIRLGYAISHEAVLKGISNVKINTGFRGRWEVLQQRPLVICDTGHNVEGMQFILKQIATLTFRHLHIVIGMVEDKDIHNMLGLLPKSAGFYFCKADIPRGLDAIELARQAALHGLEGRAYSSVNEAYMAALQAAAADDLVFVGGSTFVVAEVI